MKTKNTKLHTSCDIFQQAAFHTSLNGFPSMGARASLFDTGKNGTIIAVKTANYFEMTLSISIKILHVKIWMSYSALVYITCMSHM